MLATISNRWIWFSWKASVVNAISVSYSVIRCPPRVVVVCPQMLRVALLCVCAVAFGHVSARSDSGNFLDDKWLAGRWDKFRDVSNISGLCYCLIYAPLFSPIVTLVGLRSCAPRFVVLERRVTGAPSWRLSHVHRHSNDSSPRWTEAANASEKHKRCPGAALSPLNGPNYVQA